MLSKLQARVHVHLLCDCFITHVYTFMTTLHFCFIVSVVRKRPSEKSGSGEAGGAVKKPPKKRQKPEGMFIPYTSIECTLILYFLNYKI